MNNIKKSIFCGLILLSFLLYSERYSECKRKLTPDEIIEEMMAEEAAEKKVKEELEKYSAEEWNQIGLSHHKKNEYEKAAKCYENAIKLHANHPDHSKYPPAYYNLARVQAIFYSQKKLKEKDIDKIISNLAKAFDLKYELREKADKDDDFSSLSNSEKFKQVMLLSFLKICIVKNDFDDLKKNIKELKDINKYDTLKNTLLFYAVKEKRIDFVKLLIEKKANVNRGFCGPNSPLFYALHMFNQHGDDYFDVIFLLINNTTDVNARMNIPDDIYHLTFEEVYLKAQEKEFNPSDYDEMDYIINNESLFGNALHTGNKKLIKLFFDKNVDIDTKDGSRPVFVFLSKNDKDLVKFVIEYLKTRKGGEKYIKYIESRN